MEQLWYDNTYTFDLPQRKGDQHLLSLPEININTSLVILRCARRRRLVQRSNDELKIGSPYDLGLGSDQVSEDQMIPGFRLHLVVLGYRELRHHSKIRVSDVIDGQKTTSTDLLG